MIDATRFQGPTDTLAAAMKVAETIQDWKRKERFLTSLLSNTPLFYRVAIAQEFFEQMPTQNTPHFPDEATMFFRMGLILEELKETFQKGLGIKLNVEFEIPTEGGAPDMAFRTYDLESAIIASGQWDLDEFADGLSDMNVVIAGTAIMCAIPMDLIDWDNHCANMSKLGDDARPQINGVSEGRREGEPDYNPDLPVGKWIKGPNYVQANPSRIMGLDETEN